MREKGTPRLGSGFAHLLTPTHTLTHVHKGAHSHIFPYTQACGLTPCMLSLTHTNSHEQLTCTQTHSFTHADLEKRPRPPHWSIQPIVETANRCLSLPLT